MQRIARKPKHDVLITGGTGFLGAHLAAHLLANTDSRINIFDDLAGPGCEQNLAWLNSLAGQGRLKLWRCDLRRASCVTEAARDVDEIYHLAPYDIREQGSLELQGTNIVGASNVLDAARRSDRVPLVICAARFSGSSADRLVQDYAHLHHLPAVVLRLDSVAGPRQWAPATDWVARLTYATLGGHACNVPGNPSRLRSVLHVSDVIQAMMAARAYMGRTAGAAYNLTGGTEHCATVREVIRTIERVCHRTATIDGVKAAFAPFEPICEDPSFVMDTSWRARRSLEETVRDIVAFWHAHRTMIEQCQSVQPIPTPLLHLHAA